MCTNLVLGSQSKYNHVISVQPLRHFYSSVRIYNSWTCHIKLSHLHDIRQEHYEFIAECPEKYKVWSYKFILLFSNFKIKTSRGVLVQDDNIGGSWTHLLSWTYWIYSYIKKYFLLKKSPETSENFYTGATKKYPYQNGWKRLSKTNCVYGLHPWHSNT